MTPFTWAEFSKMHPFAPVGQAQGYAEMMEVSIKHKLRTFFRLGR